MPPVSRAVLEPPYGTTPADAFLNFGYAFQSPAWRRLELSCVLLTRVYRQRDGELIELPVVAMEQRVLDRARRAG